APAQNARPRPVSTIARTPRARNSASASSRAARRGSVKRLSGGASSSRMPTWPSTLACTVAGARSAATVVPVPQLEILAGVAADVLQLLLAHLAHRLGGHAHHEPAGLHHLARRHERAGADLRAV